MASRAREDRRPVLVRIDAAAILLFLVLGTLICIYWVQQVLRSDDYLRQAESNRQRSVPVTAPRGYIRDRNGQVLAQNEPAYALLFYRRETRDLAASLRFVAEALARDPDELTRIVERGRTYYDFIPIVLADNLTLAEVSAVESHALEHPELKVQPTQRRVYPQGTMAAHLLGHLGEATPEQVAGRSGRLRPGESIGQKGVEAAYQDLLAGLSGARSFVIDSFGREVGELQSVSPLPGNTLFLTIDLELQKVAEEHFKDHVGSAVALDPRTGEILALVSAPSFDPNLFTRRVTKPEWDALLANEDKPLNNRVLQNTYPPGSVWKAFVAHAALMHGVKPTDRVSCPGALNFYGRSFRCHHTHGSVDLATALQVSCDSYFYTVGKRVGVDLLAESARLFGFGGPTGIDLSGEKTGTVPSTEWSLAARKHPWYPGETISVAIGQGPVLVTALQLARGFAGLANADGAIPTPHLFHIGENVSTQERFVHRPRVKDHVPYAPGVREAIVEGLYRVVNVPGGTAYASRKAGLDICGKTGSVQVVAQKDTKKAHLLPDELKDHGWFACFAPRENPRIVVVVFAEHGEHGNTAAAPLATRMVERYLKGPGAPRPAG